VGVKAVLAVADQAIFSLTSFGTSVLIGRACGKADLGVYSLALSVTLLARGVQEQLVVAPYMIYAHRREGDDLAAYTGSSLAHHLAFAAAVMLGALALAGWLVLGQGAAGTLRVVLALAGALPLMLLRDYIRGLSLARLELASVLRVDGLVALLQVGTLLVLAWRGALSVTAAYAVMGAACAAASCGWFLGSRRFRFHRAAVWSDWWGNWSFGRWALASYLIGCCSPVIVPWLLAWRCGKEATGVLAAGMTLVGFAGVLVGGLTNLAVPRASKALARDGAAGLTGAMWEMAAMVSIPSAAFFLLALVAGDWMAVLVYGVQFHGVGLVLTVLALWLLVNSVGIAAGSGLWAMERPAANLVADVCVLGIILAAVPALALAWGPLGAALGMLAGTGAGAALRWATAGYYLKALRAQGTRSRSQNPA
jgi:O-antigen/teichoic acid export membrane protein